MRNTNPLPEALRPAAWTSDPARSWLRAGGLGAAIPPSRRVGLHACAGLALALAAVASNAQPQRFAPGHLQQDGRISMTPVFAADGQRLYFTQSECGEIGRCPQRLKTSTRSAGGWSRPRLLPIDPEVRADWPSLSPDGSRLLFAWAPTRPEHAALDVREDFDLYSLDLGEPGAQPQRLEGPDLNRVRGGAIKRTRFVHNETQPLLLDNGELYFWSERLDGIGGRDVYRAVADGGGGWQRPVALASPVNGSADDAVGWIDGDAQAMLITSNRAGGLGGADLYLVLCEGGRWGAPRNLGESVNSEFEDFAPRLSPDRSLLLFSSTRPFPGQVAGLIQIWSVPLAQVAALGAVGDAEAAAATADQTGTAPEQQCGV